MKKLFIVLASAILPYFLAHGDSSYVTGHLMGQLGNQMFIVAAATSLALDHEAVPLFPDFGLPSDPLYKLSLNYEKVFHRCSKEMPSKTLDYIYREPSFEYRPIPYTPNMSIFGWFQSDKYFKHHKQYILDLFAPSPEVMNYLKNKYAHIIDNPKTVSIHYRSYKEEDPENLVYAPINMAYYKKAMACFPHDSLFVVFSNDIEWCKENFSNLNYDFIFIEGETHFHDLYLMSLCYHNIIANSSFSWWGAYLNANPNKLVIVPGEWFHSTTYFRDCRDLIPDEWTILN